jgi:AraC-like DNA-binding protein
LYRRNGIKLDCFGLVEPTIPLPTFNSTLNDICLDSRDTIVAWKIGEQFDLACLGELGESISIAPTLYDALKAFEIGFCTVQTESQASLSVENNVAKFEYRILDYNIWPRRNDALLTLGLVKGVVERYHGSESVPIDICFEHMKGEEFSALSANIQSIPNYEQNYNSISFPASLLERKLSLDQITAFEAVFWDLCARIASEIYRNLGKDALDQTSIARTLAMSRRTLRRKLEESNQTFKEILNDCRKSTAVNLLARTRLPLCQIALALGYSDQTAFTRAFSRWYGMSPSRFRKEAPELSLVPISTS